MILPNLVYGNLPLCKIQQLAQSPLHCQKHSIERFWIVQILEFTQGIYLNISQVRYVKCEYQKGSLYVVDIGIQASTIFFLPLYICKEITFHTKILTLKLDVNIFTPMKKDHKSTLFVNTSLQKIFRPFNTNQFYQVQGVHV